MVGLRALAVLARLPAAHLAFCSIPTAKCGLKAKRNSRTWQSDDLRGLLLGRLKSVKTSRLDRAFPLFGNTFLRCVQTNLLRGNAFVLINYKVSSPSKHFQGNPAERISCKQLYLRIASPEAQNRRPKNRTTGHYGTLHSLRIPSEARRPESPCLRLAGMVPTKPGTDHQLL